MLTGIRKRENIVYDMLINREKEMTRDLQLEDWDKINKCNIILSSYMLFCFAQFFSISFFWVGCKEKNAMVLCVYV